MHYTDFKKIKLKHTLQYPYLKRDDEKLQSEIDAIGCE